MKPDVQTTILQLVAAMGMTAVATLIVEIMMLNIMKHKREYKSCESVACFQSSSVRSWCI